MVSPFMRAFMATKKKNRFILNHYHNVKYKKQYGGSYKPVLIDDFVFQENIDYDESAKQSSINIFIGGYDDCLISNIDITIPYIVYIQYFAYNQHCNLARDLDKNTGTTRMMKAFIKYIQQKHPEITTIKLTDDARTTCDDISIDLYKLYLLKYGASFYEKRFGFEIDMEENARDVIDLHKSNCLAAHSNNILLDKDFLMEKLQILGKYDIHTINKFINKLTNGQRCMDFLSIYKAPLDECRIFYDFLDIIFYKYMKQLRTSIIYRKNLEQSKKLTKKAFSRVSSRLSRRYSKKYTKMQKST